MSYYEKAEGRKFNELVSDPEMQKDLVRFFTGSRYKYTMDDIKELGPAGLADKFIDHMRWQETNEMTVAKDLYFAKSSKDEDPEGLESFGRLILAWDNSEGGGTGVLDGAADYFQAFATSPSTIGTVVTAGFGGPVAKILGGGAKKGGQMAVRKLLTDTLTKQTTKGFIKDKVAVAAAKESMGKAGVRGGLQGAAVEGAIEGASAYGREDIREEAIQGYEKDMGRVAASAALSGAIGGGLGAFARTSSIKKQNEAIDILAGQGARLKTAEAQSAKAATEALDKAKKAAKGTPKSKEYDALKKRMSNLTDLLQKREAGKVSQFKKPLDEESVELGKDVAAKIFEGTGEEPVTARFTSGTLRKVSAATLEIGERLGFNLADDVRISQKVADALREGRIDSEGLDQIRRQYGLSRSDFSLMFLTDMSEAGRTLNIASQIQRGLSKSQADKAAERAKKDIKDLVNNLNDFARQGITSPADETVENMARSLTSGNFVNAMREADSFRIGMMTTQLATTAANVLSSGGRIVTDMSDQFFLNTIQGKNPFRGTTDVLKGLTWGKEEAHVARILAELDPESSLSKMFYDISRVETETGSNSALARTARFFNTVNNLVDTQFKEAVMYSSLQRQIRDSGDEVLAKTFDDYLRKGTGLDALPPQMVEKAKRDALSFSYQYGYEGAQDWFGKGANTLINTNKKYPFLVSAGLGMPFPRYIANQLEYIHRHMPTGLAQGLWEKASGQGSRDLLVSSDEKIAQGLTGTMMLLGAIGARYYADPSTNYRETIDGTSGDIQDWSRAGGPYMAHLFIGDMIARHMKGEDPLYGVKDSASEAVKILAGLNAYGYNNSVIEPIVTSVEEGELNEAAAKWLGDIAASLTMPAATVRDIQGQFNPDATPSPYTRNLQLEAGEEGPQSFGQTLFAQRAMRFLPDFEWVQFASSFNGKTDVPLYDGFGQDPVMKVNPITSQLLGFDTRPKKNAIQREMSKFGIEPYEIVGSKTFRNPNVDVAVRKLMSQSISPAFEDFRNTHKFVGGLTYDQLQPEAQEKALMKFINLHKQGIEDKVEQTFTEFARKSPRAAAGFIVNNYALQEKKYKNLFGSMDRVMQWAQIDMTPEEYFNDAETVEKRLARMQEVLNWAAQLENFEKRNLSR